IVAIAGYIAGPSHDPTFGPAVSDGEVAGIGSGRADEDFQGCGAHAIVGGMADIQVEIDLAMEIVLLQEGQQECAPAPTGAVVELRPGGRVVVADGESTQRVVVVL